MEFATLKIARFQDFYKGFHTPFLKNIWGFLVLKIFKLKCSYSNLNLTCLSGCGWEYKWVPGPEPSFITQMCCLAGGYFSSKIFFILFQIFFILFQIYSILFQIFFILFLIFFKLFFLQICCLVGGFFFIKSFFILLSSLTYYDDSLHLKSTTRLIFLMFYLLNVQSIWSCVIFDLSGFYHFSLFYRVIAV